jgi:hypothetical protein
LIDVNKKSVLARRRTVLNSLVRIGRIRIGALALGW